MSVRFDFGRVVTGLVWMFALVTVLWVGLIVAALPIFAQTPAQTQTSSATPALAVAAPAADGMDAMGQTMGQTMDGAVRLRGVIRNVIQLLPDLPEDIREVVVSKGGDGTLSWLWTALGLLIVCAAAGLIALVLTHRWAAGHFAPMRNAPANSRQKKIAVLMTRAIVMLIEVLVFASVAGVVALALDGDDPVRRRTLFTGIVTLSIILTGRVLFLNILAPDTSRHRMLAFSDRDARNLYRALLGGLAVTAILFGFTVWLAKIGLDMAPIKLLLLMCSAVSVVTLGITAVIFRRPVQVAILGGYHEHRAPGPVRLIARFWHVIAVLYFLFAFGVTAVRTLLDKPLSFDLVAAPLQTSLLALVFYGLLLLIIDRILPRLDTDENCARLTEALERIQPTEGDSLATAATVAEAEAHAFEQETTRQSFRKLLDHGAAVLTLMGAIWVLLRIWGVSVADDAAVLHRVAEVALTAFLAYMAYRSVQISVQQQLRKQTEFASGDFDPEMAEMGESRLATLLPIFRTFLLITIVLIAAMIILSSLGVNIAPVFAGAGVIGLAIGFGAQTLIRDIFSGAFFLLDDAFRKGEYIDIGSAKGTVEKISIRSFQLRHHRGALTTVPFGEIKSLQNQSRDWAIMKLAFKVIYDTDTDLVRRLIKKFGQQLMTDPYYGPMLLDPPKSQGIMAMEDYAMVVRVKFMTKPGKQFELRKVVYAGVQDLFMKNGIRFSNQQITYVRIANEEGQPIATPTPVQIAAAGAVAKAETDAEVAADKAAAV